jgi:hypothetical protein
MIDCRSTQINIGEFSEDYSERYVYLVLLVTRSNTFLLESEFSKVRTRDNRQIANLLI